MRNELQRGTNPNEERGRLRLPDEDEEVALRSHRRGTREKPITRDKGPADASGVELNVGRERTRC
jgi:hypothetical protein